LVNKKFPTLFFFLITALSLFVFLPSTIEPVYASGDYDIFEITDTSSSLYETYVWDNFLYLYNDTFVYQYDLATKTQNDSIALGGSTIVHSTIGRGDFLYLNATVIADRYVIAIDLVQFIEADRIITTSLTDWNGDLKNIAYLYDSGTDYWAWINVTGDEIVLTDNSFATMNAYSMPYPQYPRFLGYAEVQHHAQIDNPFTMTCYIHNGTGVEFDTAEFSCDQSSGVTIASTWNLTPNIIVTDTHQITTGQTYTQMGYNIYAFTDTQSRFEDSDDYAVYYSGNLLSTWSLRSDDFQELEHETGHTSYDYEIDTLDHIVKIDSDEKDIVKFVSSRVNPASPYWHAGVGSYTTADLYHEGDFDRDNPIGVCAGIDTLDQNGFMGLYIAWVQDQNQTPVVVRFVGGGDAYQFEVGVLPAPYDPTDCVLWANQVGEWDDYQDDGIVAIWIEDADTTLYVCVNLIEGQYMRYGDDVNVKAQVYKHYPSGTTDNWRLETRWMIDTANYPRIANAKVYVYEDDVYLHTLTTNGYGITQAIYAFNPATYPQTISCYMNKTGYNDQWLNVTYYDWHSQSSDTTVKEAPDISLEFSDNRESENMRVTLDILRYTGEEFGEDWFNDVLTVHVYVETYAGTSLDSIIDVGILDSDINGKIEFILSYTEPYGYVVKHYYNTDEQYIYIGNFTANSQVQFAYDASTGNLTEGEYVSLPDTPSTSEFYPTSEDAINPTTLEGFSVIWSGNTGFLIALGFITAITVGFAKVSPESAIFGVITLVGITIGFLGYTGLLPFPIFVVTLLVIVLGITVIFTNMLTGGSGKKSE